MSELNPEEIKSILKRKGYTVTVEKWASLNPSLKICTSYKQATIHIIGKNATKLTMPKKIIESLPKFKGGVLEIIKTPTNLKIQVRIGDKTIPLSRQLTATEELVLTQTLHSPKQAEKLKAFLHSYDKTPKQIIELLNTLTQLEEFEAHPEHGILLIKQEGITRALKITSNITPTLIQASLTVKVPQLDEHGLVLVLNEELQPEGVLLTNWGIYLPKTPPMDHMINIKILQKLQSLLDTAPPQHREILSTWVKQIF